MKKLVYILTIVCTVAQVAWGQTDIQLDEVVVNGVAKSTQTIDRQGVSYTLLDSAFVADHDVRDLTDLSHYVPGLEIPQYGSRLTSSMYVRGVGSRINSPSVGVYYEGIPLLFKTAMNRHYYGVDKMAVMRGPQGTLYGLNSEGGLIIAEGNNPLDEVRKSSNAFRLHAGIENHGGRNIEGGFVFPLSAVLPHLADKSFVKNIAISAQAFYRGTNGYQHNKFLDQRADWLEEGGGKLKIGWNASDKLRVTLFGDIQRVAERGFAYSDSTNLLGSYYRTTFDTGLDIIYNMGKWRLLSTTSFQYLNDDMAMDQDYTAMRLMHMTQHQCGKAATEELNLKADLSRRWKVSNGLYLAHQWLTAFSPVYFDEDFTANISGIIQRAMTAQMPPQMAQYVTVGTTMSVPGEYRTPMMNLGVFHESHFDFTKDFSATIGLRYDFNRQDVDYLAQSFTAVTVDMMQTKMTRNITSVLQNKHHHSYSQILPKLSLRYKDWYATVSKGYRAGGYNFQMFSDILQGEFQQNTMKLMAALREGDIDFPHDEATYKEVEDRISYDPEFSWNYEIGGKHSIINHQSSIINLRYAAFYSKVQDLQLSVMADSYGYGRMMKNAGKSTSFGGELSIDGSIALGQRSVPGASIAGQQIFYSAAYSFTRTKFLDDKRVPYIPAHTVNAAIGYKWSRYSAEVNMNGRGKTYWTEDNKLSSPFYALFGARASADFGFIKATLWTRNLLNYRPTTFAFTSSATGQERVFSQIGEPFMAGINIDVKL